MPIIPWFVNHISAISSDQNFDLLEGFVLVRTLFIIAARATASFEPVEHKLKDDDPIKALEEALNE